jgi:hypothetical protein
MNVISIPKSSFSRFSSKDQPQTLAGSYQVGYNFGILHNYRKHHYDHKSITTTEIVLAANVQQAKQSLPLFYLTREHTNMLF